MTHVTYITLCGEVVRATRKAVLLQFNTAINGKHAVVEHWVPRSVCIDGDTLTEGDHDVLVAEWFVDKEGLPND